MFEFSNIKSFLRMTITELIEVVLFIIAIGGVIFGYGKLNSRVNALEGSVRALNRTSERLASIETSNEFLKSSVTKIEAKLDRLLADKH